MKTRKQKSTKIDNISTNKIIVDKNSKVCKMPSDILMDAQLENKSNNIKNIPHQLYDTNTTISTIIRKKKFGKPLIISSCLNNIPSKSIPSILRIKTKSKLTHKNQDILRNIISTNSGKQVSSKINIGASIIPDDAIITNFPKSHTVEKISSTNLSINCDENLVQSVQNDTTGNLDTGPVPHFYSLRNKVICVMEPLSKFSFYGKVKIQVLYGGVKIYGTIIIKSNSETPINVYSPRGSNLVAIHVITLNECSDDLESIWSVLKKDNIDCNVSNALQSDINNVKKGWSVIILQNFENNLTTFLEKNCNYKLFPIIEDASNYSWSDIKRAEGVLQANIYCGNYIKQSINFNGIDETIEKVMMKCVNNKKSKVLMTGGKSVGKSTTLRYLLNRILKKFNEVIVIDLDPGQSEFTPPGCISINIVKKPLFGPNFTHFKKPYYQLYIGSMDVTRCLSTYINGIKKLMQHFNRHANIMELPTIINTMGFCRGVGWDIMTSIIKVIQPTDIIQIISDRPKNNFDQLLSTDIINNQINTWTTWQNSSGNNDELSIVEYELHIVNSQAETKNTLGEMWNIEPHQQREIAMLAYLSEIHKSQINSTLYDNNSQMNINSIVPYQVPFSSMKLSLGYPTVPQILSVMNGNIVALCGNDSCSEQTKSIEENSTSYPEVFIRQPLSTCYGFGILRGVDMEKEKMYINTPLSTSELKHVNCIMGCIPVPSGLLQLNRFGGPYTGGNYDLPTSRDPRRGYFRMKYRNNP